MSEERVKAILKYLVRDINAEIACWGQSIKCFSNNTTNETLLAKIKVLESKVHAYSEFVKNIQTLLTVDIEFMNSNEVRIYRVSITMSHFELVLNSFGFEGHSKSQYWDYNKYGHVKDKALTRILWIALIKHGYIPFEHINWVGFEGVHVGLESFWII